MEEKKVFHSPSPIWTDEVWALIHVYTAVSFAEHKGCTAEIEKIYETDKYRFYQLSEQHPMYRHRHVLSMRLEKEIVCRHALGILWAADDDEKLRSKIFRLIKRVTPELYNYTVSPNRKNIEAYRVARHKALEVVMRNGFSDGFMDYLQAWVYSSVDDMHKTAREHYDVLLEHYTGEAQEKTGQTEMFAKHDSPSDEEKDIQTYFNSLDRMDLMTHFINLKVAPDSEKSKLRDLCIHNFEKSKMISLGYLNVDRLFEMSDLTAQILLDKSPLDEETHQKIVDIAYCLDNYGKTHFDPQMYVNCFAMYRLIEEYKRTKDCYFRVNEEIANVELRQRDEQIQSLTGQLTALTEQNQRLKQENEQLRQNELLRRKEENDLIRKATKPLQKQVDTLQKQLRQIQEANYDNAELREFIFHLEDTVPEKNIPVDFAELSGRYKIATLGGHEILRNKLKEKFPDFKVLDGTQNSLDFTALLKSTDILFIFTGHMSHAVYEKAIATVSQNNCKFYYINNATNLDIITAQMSRYLLESI